MRMLMHLGLGLTLSFFTVASYANPHHAKPKSAAPCEEVLFSRPATLSELTQNAEMEQQALRQETPLRTFVDPEVDQGRIEKGFMGPQALADMHPQYVQFQQMQSPFAETPAVVKRDSPGPSWPARIEFEFNGQPVSTTVYTSTPNKIREPKAEYLIGPEHKETGVVFWMHGGGTPTATGDNANSVAIEAVRRMIAVIAPDGPGHSNSSLYPFTSGQEMLDYYLEMIRKTVHPDVPVIIMGHSWGGQFAIQMHLQWNKLKTSGVKVQGFVALSPPADLSLGGSARERQVADARVDACFNQWKSRVADGDYEFIENVVRNGKTSPVAALYCSISQLDYSWKAPQDKTPRPRLMVIMGESDGLVYTGREAAFEAFIGQIVNPEDFVLLKKGRTFKGEARTGHNVFDRYMDEEDRVKMADFLGKDKDKKDLAEVYTRLAHFVSQQVGHPLPKMPPSNMILEPFEAMDRIYRLYANNLAFRQFVKTYVHRDFSRTELTSQLHVRRQVLEEYIKRANEAAATAAAQAERELQAQIDQLAKQQRIKSVLFARKELPITQSAERTAELHAALAAAKPIRDQVIRDNPNRTHEAILALSSRPNDIESFEQAQAELKMNISRERRKQLEAFMHAARTIMNQYDRDLGNKISTALMAVSFPPGAKSINDMVWELELDTSAARKNTLAQFLRDVEAIESGREQQVSSRRAQAIAAIRPPEGVRDFAAAQSEAEDIRSKVESQYIPEGPEAEKAKLLINRINETTKTVSQTGTELANLFPEIVKLKNERGALLKKFEATVSQTDHPELRSLVEVREKALDIYTAANKAYDTEVATQLSRAYDSGKLDAAFVRHLFLEVGPFVQQYNHGRNAFLRASRNVESTQLKLALSGSLGAEAQALAVQLYGKDGKDGLEQRLKDKIQSRNSLQQIRANENQELAALMKKYNEVVPGYYELREVALQDLLDRPYLELMNLMKWDASKKDKDQLTPEERAKKKERDFYFSALMGAIKEFNDMWDTRDIPERKGADLN